MDAINPSGGNVIPSKRILSGGCSKGMNTDKILKKMDTEDMLRIVSKYEPSIRKDMLRMLKNGYNEKTCKKVLGLT